MPVPLGKVERFAALGHVVPEHPRDRRDARTMARRSRCYDSRSTPRPPARASRRVRPARAARAGRARPGRAGSAEHSDSDRRVDRESRTHQRRVNRWAGGSERNGCMARSWADYTRALRKLTSPAALRRRDQGQQDSQVDEHAIRPYMAGRRHRVRPIQKTGRPVSDSLPVYDLESGCYPRSGFHTRHTLPTRSGPGLRVGLPGCQPAGVTSPWRARAGTPAPGGSAPRCCARPVAS